MKARNTLLFRLFLIYEAVFAVAIPIILLATWLSKGGLQVQGVFYAFLVSQLTVALLMLYSYWKYRKFE